MARDILVRPLTTFRTLLIVFGVISALLGLVILIWPDKSAVWAVAILVTIYAIGTGIAQVIAALFARDMGPWERIGWLVLGVLFIIGGIVALSNLGTATQVLAVLLGILVGVLWLIEGIFMLATVSYSPAKGWSVFSGILSIVAGVLLLLSPIWGAVVLWIFLGASLLVIGIVQIVQGIALRRIPD